MNGIVSSFTNILDAAALSTSLQILRLGTLYSPRLCEALIAKLPTFRNVRSLAFSLDDSCAHFKTRLLTAFRENGSLTQWEIDANFLEDQDFVVLRFCADRNAKLPALLASKPGTSRLPIGALPSLFCRSFDTMHGTAGSCRRSSNWETILAAAPAMMKKTNGPPRSSERPLSCCCCLVSSQRTMPIDRIPEKIRSKMHTTVASIIIIIKVNRRNPLKDTQQQHSHHSNILIHNISSEYKKPSARASIYLEVRTRSKLTNSIRTS